MDFILGLVGEFILGHLDRAADVRDAPGNAVRRWKERTTVVPVRPGRLPELHELVTGTSQAMRGRSPDVTWVVAGCAIRARRRDEGYLHVHLGAAALLVLPADELRALVARAVELTYLVNQRSWLRAERTTALARLRQRDADEAMTRLAPGPVAAAALLHQAVAADRFAHYLTERVGPLRRGDALPGDVYAGWRERCRDEVDRARYAAGFDLDRVEPADRPAEYPPLRERLERLTGDIDRIGPFPDGPAVVDRFTSMADFTLSRATLRRVGNDGRPGARRR